MIRNLIELARELVVDPLLVWLTRRTAEPPPASAPCAGPCGCELIGEPVRLGRARIVETPTPLTEVDAARLARGIEASGILDAPEGSWGWMQVGDAEVRVLTDAEVAGLIAAGDR